MSIIGSIKGWPLLDVPLTPGHRQVDWSMVNITGGLTVPYTGAQQIYNWKAARWEAVVTMPSMLREKAEAWIALLAQSQGMNAVFYFGDQRGATPQGTAEGNGVTAGSFQGGYQLTTRGWKPGQFALLSPGDWLQVGWRLYKCMDQVSSDGAGNASFAIWPPIREIPPNGTSIVTINAKGLFRMKQNTLRYSVSYDRTYRMSFEIREAL